MTSVLLKLKGIGYSLLGLIVFVLTLLACGAAFGLMVRGCKWAAGS